MNVTKAQLDALLECQSKMLENLKLEKRAAEIKDSLQADAVREEMLRVSAQLNQLRGAHEDLERDRRKQLDELDLVKKRLQQDQDRLTRTAVAKDAMGLQHEIETLNKRHALLQEQLEAVDGLIEQSFSEQQELQNTRDQLEESAEETREQAKAELESLKKEHLGNRESIASLRASVSTELLELFDRRSARGVAIGRLRNGSCGACNMNLTGTAIAALSAISQSELASCPDCQAILVR